MPSLSDRLVDSNTVNITTPTTDTTGKPAQSLSQPINISGFMRCPLPPIFSSNPDSLRQFYVGGSVPQIRIFT